MKIQQRPGYRLVALVACCLLAVFTSTATASNQQGLRASSNNNKLNKESIIANMKKDDGKPANVRVRKLQDHSVSYEVPLKLAFFFEADFVPIGPLIAVDNFNAMISATQVFFRQVLSSQYSVSYHESTTTFVERSFDFISTQPPFVLAFDIIVTGTYRLTGDVPNPDEALDAFLNWDPDVYRDNYLHPIGENLQNVESVIFLLAGLDGFSFQTSFNGNYPPQYQELTQGALSTIESIITGDLIPTIMPLGLQVSNCILEPSFVDDTFVCANWGVLDFPSDNVLAAAGPRWVRTDFLPKDEWTPVIGEIFVNPDSASNFPGGQFPPETFQLIMTHESLHIMGIGTLWGDRFHELVNNDDTTECSYKADTNAGRQFQAISGCPSTMEVPMEQRQRPGAPAGVGVCAHWDQDCFGGTELMNPTAQGPFKRLSAVTIGSLEDMGYEVDYAAGDPLTDEFFSRECMCSSSPTAGTNFVEKPPLSAQGHSIAQAFGLAHLAAEQANYESLGGDEAMMGEKSNMVFVGHKVVAVMIKEGDYFYDVVVRNPNA